MAGLLLAGLIAAGARFGRNSQLRRRLSRTPAFTLAAIPEDTLGRVTGTAHRLDETLVSPLFGRPCVYYLAEVELDRDGGVPTIIAREARGLPFVLDDATGRAIVDPDSAEIAIDLDREAHDVWGATRGTRRAFLMRVGQGDVADVDELWFREAVFAVGAGMAVVGSGVREPVPQAAPVGGYRGEVPTRLRLTSSPAHRLVIGRR